MVFQVGETVGPYQVTDKLGQGGMATVYRGYHANLDRYVAIKVLHAAFKEDPNFLERFKREAQIVAKLEHPHIIPIYDYADHQGYPYLVMKFIEGETLKARLKRGPLTLDETLRILDTVAQALTFAHQHGILHRDIKPSNIMLDRAGRPYIADFGLARIAQAGESTLSQDVMLGTPQYISPEQAKGDYNLGPSTDIYSLGVVLYEVVVGRVPFNADTPYAIVHDHIYKPLPLPTQINPQVPMEVERVLLRALSKDATARYESAVDMIAAFQQAVQDAGMTELSAAQSRPPIVSISTSAPTVLPDAALPSAPVSPGATPVYTGVPSPISQTAHRQAEREAYRRRANLWILGGFGLLLLTCLVSLFIIARAVSDPSSRPWNIGDQADVTAAPGDRDPHDQPPPPVLPTLLDLNVDEAQALIDQHPEQPANYLQLGMALLREGDRKGAFDNVTQAIERLEKQPEALTALARSLADSERNEFAILVYLTLLANDPVPTPVRSEAGQYLFEQAQTDPERMRTMTALFLAEHGSTASAHTVQALALLNLDRAVYTRLAGTNLDDALALKEDFAEFYLVRGHYYLKIDRTEDALNAWQQARELEDAPRWVVERADQLLDTYSPTVS